MELRQLATFRVLAVTLNFHQTAERLGYVQSTVTAQIQALEAELGTQLFDRLGRHIGLTQAGERLLPYAEQMLNMAEEARQAVSATQEFAGTLRIGASETLCAYRLPAVLHQYRRAYPQVQLLFYPSPFSALRRMVADGQVDLAFLMEEPIISATFHARELLLEPIHLVAAPEHPLANRSRVLPADLENATVLMTEAGCSYRTQFQHQLNRAGIQPEAVLEFDSIEAIKQCARIGMGVAVLPAVVVETEIEQGKLVVLPWAEEAICLRTQMLWHKQKSVSPALRAFLQIAQEVLMETSENTTAGND